MSSAADPLSGKFPVTVITGFLGSGKTTLIRRLLTHPDMNRIAVIINELGEVGIDHELVEVSSESMKLLANGCLCCSVRTDLQETLRELFIKRRAGEIIDFNRVMIETTGLADPVPVIHSLLTDGMLAAQYRLDGVVTLVDAVNGAGTLDRMVEAVKQVAVADRLVLTKTDLASPAQIEQVRSKLAELNASAIMETAVNGELAPSFFIDVGPRNARESDLSRWLGPLASSSETPTYLGQRVLGSHTANVGSFALWFDTPFTWDSFSRAMDTLTALRGPDLLRVKGLVNIEGEPGPVVVQGAQHVFHMPARLQAWRDDDHRSRIVFITRGIKREAVEALFRAVGMLGDSLPVASTTR